MEYSINIIVDEEDKICIPRTNRDNPHINIHCAMCIHNATYIKHLLESATYLNPTAYISLHCHMLPNLQIVLPDVNELHITLDSNQDFNNFLHFDNHLALSDTNGKKLHLYASDDISIDNCKPNDLPTIWTVHTLPSKVKSVVAVMA